MYVYLHTINHQKIHTMKITKINYFGQETGTDDWNAKVVYTHRNKTHIALVYICFFWKKFHATQSLQKKYSCDAYQYKLYSGLLQTLNQSNYFQI